MVIQTSDADGNVNNNPATIESGSTNATVVGNGAKVNGANASAFGTNANAQGANTSAIGQGANANGENASAIGQGATATGANASAIGQGANAQAENATAIGQGATVAPGATGSVAIGQGSVASEAGTMSVGSVGNERRITNVAPGVNNTDAANMGQLRDVEARLGDRMNKVDRKLRGGIASAVATANIPQVTLPGRNLVGLGVGNYNGQSAVAVGYSRASDNNKVIIKMSAGASTQKDYTIGAGIGYQW